MSFELGCIFMNGSVDDLALGVFQDKLNEVVSCLFGHFGLVEEEELKESGVFCVSHDVEIAVFTEQGSNSLSG